ncbi:MAG: hypothetical protein ACFWTJ_03235 [Lachnoclostridium sp.]|jgi:hypothetical protein
MEYTIKQVSEKTGLSIYTLRGSKLYIGVR